MDLQTLRARALIACVAALIGCKTGSPNTAVGAATMTGAAIGAAAVSVKSGGCIAMCTNGTVCNPNTGLCERHKPDPCADTFTGACVQASGSVSTTADGGVVQPIAPVVDAPDSNHAAPTIVPAAEKTR